jgi:hypothetical protein
MTHMPSRQYLRARALRVIRWAAFTILSLSPVVSLQNAEAAEASFVDFPFLVHCALNGVDRAYYLSRIDTDGVAVYISPDDKAGTITIAGTAKPIGGDWSGSCSGKTLAELRSAGQAYYLQP